MDGPDSSYSALAIHICKTTTKLGTFPKILAKRQWTSAQLYSRRRNKMKKIGGFPKSIHFSSLKHDGQLGNPICPKFLDLNSWDSERKRSSEIACWKVLREAKIDPPIQTLYFLSGGATTLIFMLLGAKAVISLLIRSAIPGNIVDPPERTMLPYKSFRISTSHFMMEL